MTAGTYWLIARADAVSVVVETNESNNNRSVSFQVTLPASPDEASPDGAPGL